jgi:hypothetical protein
LFAKTNCKNFLHWAATEAQNFGDLNETSRDFFRKQQGRDSPERNSCPKSSNGYIKTEWLGEPEEEQAAAQRRGGTKTI